MPNPGGRPFYQKKTRSIPSSKFIDTSKNTSLAIAICDRCHFKFAIGDLYSDPNSPGLKVCMADLDDFDPYRLPQRVPEIISLPFARPDTTLGDIATADHPDAIPTFLDAENIPVQTGYDGYRVDQESGLGDLLVERNPSGD